MEDDLPAHSLLRQPDIAREVGFLVMYSANLEIWLLEIFQILLKKTPDFAGIIFGNIDNIRTKIDVIYGLCELRRGWPVPDALLPTKEKVLEAIAFRNAIAHGQHGLSSSGKPNLTSNFLTLKRGKPKTITLSPDLIRSHTEVLRSTIFLMRKFVGADLLVQHHGPIDGVLPASPETPSQATQETRRPHKDRQSPKSHTQPGAPQE